MAEITIQYLFQKYKNDVYSYLISLTHDKTLSEDLTSETFLGAIKSLPRYKGKSDIKTWLFSIARFKWYEHLRHEKIPFTDDDLLEIYAVSEINIEKDFVNSELIARIYELLESETEKNKSVLLMRVEGYSFYEIGLQHHISENSARVIDFRLRTKLRQILKEEGYSYE